MSHPTCSNPEQTLDKDPKTAHCGERYTMSTQTNPYTININTTGGVTQDDIRVARAAADLNTLVACRLALSDARAVFEAHVRIERARLESLDRLAGHYASQAVAARAPYQPGTRLLVAPRRCLEPFDVLHTFTNPEVFQVAKVAATYKGPPGEEDVQANYLVCHNLDRVTHTGNFGTRTRDKIQLYNLTDYDVDMVVVPDTCVFGDPDYCNALGELRAAQAEATKTIEEAAHA